MWVCAGIYLLLAALYMADRKKRRILGACGGLGWKLGVLLLAVNTLAMGYGVRERAALSGESVRRLWRNGYGEGQREALLRMQIEGEDEEEVRLPVAAREYGDAELRSLFQQASGQLDTLILGDNPTPDHVTEDLCLPTRLEGFPFDIVWELSRYDVMDMTGKIDREAVAQLERDGAEGVLLTLTGVLRYQTREMLYSAQVRICAGEEKPRKIGVRVRELLSSREEESRQEAYVTLPEELDGRRITWRYPVSDPAAVPALLGAAGCGLFFCLMRQKEERAERDRKEQMLLDYPEIISQFTMLMGAGMTVKQVWKKVTEDYREQKRRTGRERAAYEEMLCTMAEMNSGIPEGECYERFAGRCGSAPYQKMGALLSQSLRKGVKGTSELLQMEAIQAMEDRRSRVRRLGEEAGTKLLLPMLFMLGVVLAIVVVPAFLSIRT